jgi:hypothetical protein
MAFFKYRAIDLEGPAIRLVRLVKGDGDPIQCQLFEAWLHRPEGVVDYEALSYAWGGIVSSLCAKPISATARFRSKHSSPIVPIHRQQHQTSIDSGHFNQIQDMLSGCRTFEAFRQVYIAMQFPSVR